LSEQKTQAAAIDPFEQELQQIEAAIAETEASTSPDYVAAPWRRAELIEQLQDRRDSLHKARQAALVANAQQRIKEQQGKAWQRLEPKRLEMSKRWDDLRQQLAVLLADLTDLEQEHLQKTGRRLLSEPIGPTHLPLAQLVACERGLAVMRAELRRDG
jgi:response regulator RpfG family c-di-GMP phosphodiesterase